MKRKNKYAVALGKMGAGKPKTLSEAALRQRREAGFKKQVACHESALAENKVK
jgi:hypothetical protein